MPRRPTAASTCGAVDSISTVHVASWAYDGLAARIADLIGATPAHAADTTVGGQRPAELLEDAAARVAAGESRVALIAGGEAQASAQALYRAGADPAAHGWSTEPGGPASFDASELHSAAMRTTGIILPTRVYPLFENALAHARGETPARAARESAELYAAFSRVAAENPVAWNPGPRTAEEIGAAGPGNRMVCEPYPLAVNAMPHVDQAAAVLLTSLAAARDARGARRADRARVGRGGRARRHRRARPPDVQRVGGAGGRAGPRAGRSGRAAPDLDVIDVYSCFPVVPKLVADHLGLPLTALAGVTGGHSAFGGPLSSYTLHALVAVTERLRAGARLALVHGNGGYLTHQHALLLGRDPHPDGYVGDPGPRATAGPAPATVDVLDAEVVTVETATVEHDRSGAATQGFLVARTAAGARYAACTPPGDLPSALALSQLGGVRDVVGRTVRVTGKDGQAVVEEAR